MTRILDMHKKWMKDPEYAKEYDLLAGEFTLEAAVQKANSPTIPKEKR
jgi:hypothetical protein